MSRVEVDVTLTFALDESWNHVSAQGLYWKYPSLHVEWRYTAIACVAREKMSRFAAVNSGDLPNNTEQRGHASGISESETRQWRSFNVS